MHLLSLHKNIYPDNEQRSIGNIKSRRSVRTYTEQQVSAGDLNLILEAAAYAPSGMNFQTWHFTAIQDAAVLTELNEKIKGAFAKSDDPHLQERGHSETYCCYYHAPTLVIVSNEPTRWWAPMDCACALQNIFLAAKSLGIGSCWINQLGQTCDDPDVRAFLTRLGIPEITVCTAVPPWAMPLRTLP